MAAIHNGAPLPDDTIQLDFGRGYELSCWNKSVLAKHYQTILDLRAEDGGWGLPDVSEGYILGLLYGHLKRSHDGWARAQSRFCEGTGRVETREETDQRLAEENEIRYANVGSRSRRQSVSISSFSLSSSSCPHFPRNSLDGWTLSQKSWR